MKPLKIIMKVLLLFIQIIILYQCFFNSISYQSLWSEWQLLALLVGIIATLIMLLYDTHDYFHPLVTQLSKNPENLLQLNSVNLIKAQRLLLGTKRIDKVLSSNGVNLSTFSKSLEFFQTTDHSKHCQIIADRIGAQFETIDNSDIPMFKLHMPTDFLLNMDNCLLAFVPIDMDANDFFAHLKKVRDTHFQVCLIISFDQAPEKQGVIIQQKASDTGNWFVAPTHKELISLLLFSDAQKRFASIIASQVKVTRISPYQTRGGVNKDSVFFGREQLLAHIMQREPANYLLVGGRQLGKTSLLKLIERRYQNDPDKLCYLITSGLETDIIKKMAQTLNLSHTSQMSDIAHHIRQYTTDKRLIFLLDETDFLIKEQAKKGYPILHSFRSLSEENRCTFIMAGFWELYYASSYDDQSPIKNFAETLFVTALEPDACRKLATIPMQLLKFEYESDALIDLMIKETGLRANLIAITCDALLQKIDEQKRLITKDDLDEVLDSNAIRTSLAGWEQIKLDRVIVYATIHMDSFTFSDVIDRLTYTNFSFEVEQVKQSLMRLELAFIVTRQNRNYRYAVPIFKKFILESEPERMLDVLDPQLSQLSKKIENILKLSSVELLKIQRILFGSKALDKLLSMNEISTSSFSQCILFFQTTSYEKHCKIIADRIGARFETIEGIDIPLFKIFMPRDFLLNMDNFLLAFVPIDMDANDFFTHLKKVRDTSFQICLVISYDQAPVRQTIHIQKMAHNLENWFVAPDHKELISILLLAGAPLRLANIFVNQVKVTRISPYKTGGGSIKTVFFLAENNYWPTSCNANPPIICW